MSLYKEVRGPSLRMFEPPKDYAPVIKDDLFTSLPWLPINALNTPLLNVTESHVDMLTV